MFLCNSIPNTKRTIFLELCLQNFEKKNIFKDKEDITMIFWCFKYLVLLEVHSCIMTPYSETFFLIEKSHFWFTILAWIWTILGSLMQVGIEILFCILGGLQWKCRKQIMTSRSCDAVRLVHSVEMKLWKWFHYLNSFAILYCTIWYSSSEHYSK